MAKKGNQNIVGAWAFLIGVIIAVIFAFAQITPGITLTLFIIGIIVGLLNISVKESKDFLLAAVALVLIGYLGSNAMATVAWINTLLNNLLVIFVPAAVIVALREVFEIAKS